MTVHFSCVNDVREFVSLATVQGFPIFVEDGKQSVDAKSFMEMFTLDFSAPLHLRVDEEHRESFCSAAEKFLL